MPIHLIPGPVYKQLRDNGASRNKVLRNSLKKKKEFSMIKLWKSEVMWQSEFYDNTIMIPLNY